MHDVEWLKLPFRPRGLAIVGFALLATFASTQALAATADIRSGASILMFLTLVATTLLVTRWAAKRTHSRADFYVAHGRVTPLQNSLATTGDYLSAGTFLGMSALVFTAGPDTFIYLTGSLTAMVLMLFLVGERLRNLGRYTFVDVCALRFEERPIRFVGAANALAILLLSMVGQLVGAGSLIELLFGLPYAVALFLVAALLMVYVMFGGMLATTWVQIIKATLMLGGGAVVAVLVLAQFGFSFDALLARAAAVHEHGAAILGPGLHAESPGDTISLGLAMSLGSVGLPYVLMRFFTVKDGRAASRSVVYATVFVGCFFLMIAVFGYGATALLTGQEVYFTESGRLVGGENMAILHLAHRVGGPLLFGALAAVAFATILAVVSGITMSAAATVSHDLYSRAIRRGAVDERREMLISRSAVAGFCVTATLLAIVFKGQNIAFMVTLGVSIAASVNFPVLMSAMYWRGATTRGVVTASIVGLAVCVVLIVLGPMVWVDALQHPEPLFPFRYPSIVSMPISIAVLVLVSLFDRSEAANQSRLAFDRQQLQALTGITASKAGRS